MEIDEDPTNDMGGLGDTNLNKDDGSKDEGTDEDVESVTSLGAPTAKATSSNVTGPTQKENVDARQQAPARVSPGNHAQDENCILH